ncbi:MAG: molybdenum ABC transporter ATP-binding protein [Paracoccus hibiscisoli]|uniref:molybdenum ABC transporter ATP-binding protein n=1 Tax=Paracoccus hibiscisoli TaxID=2023261 RepID=UPI003918A7FE
MALQISARATAPIPLDASFRVEPGELLALVGHSGSGKTTLLRTIAGLWTPQEGRVTVGGQVWLDTAAGVNLPTHRRRVGIVVQNYALFPHMTAARNVMAAMDSPDPSEAERILDLVNLHGLSHRKPAQLSGGQQQRVALARALARRPQALLLDEPFSAVDRATRDRLYTEIIALRAKLSMPVVLVTHDMSEAQRLADSMVVIADGRIIAHGRTENVMSDSMALRSMGMEVTQSVLFATIRGHLPHGLTELDGPTGTLLVLTQDIAPGTRVALSIAAGDIILSRQMPEGLSAPTVLAATVQDLVPEGKSVLVSLQAGLHPMVCRLPAGAVSALALQKSDAVYAILTRPVVAAR